MVNASGGVDTTWFHKAYLLAGIANECAGNYLLMRWGKDQFIHNTGVDSVTVATADGDVNATVVAAEVNAGVAFLLWRGSWEFEMPDNMGSLTSPAGRFPITMTITCMAGEYADSPGADGPAEDFLVAGTPSNPKGGVAAMGTSTAGTENGANVCLAGGMIYAIADMNIEHLGTAVNIAKAQLYSAYGNKRDGEDFSTTTAHKFSRLFNLLGDPSLSMWTAVPRLMGVSFPESLTVGARSLAVTITDSSTLGPLAGATVCLWKKSPDSTWVVGTSNDQGSLVLPISVTAAGDLLLTVTKRGYKPFLATLLCTQAGASANISSYTLDDDNAGGTSGNNDGVMNPGETVDLRVYARNYGTETAATNITATLSSDNPRVTVVNSSVTYGDIAPGDSAIGSSAFRIHVAPEMQDGESVGLQVTMNGSQGTTSGLIHLECTAQKLVLLGQRLRTPFGPGLSSNLVISVRNNGTVGMSQVTGTCISLSPFVSVDVGTANFGDIAAGQSDSNATDFVLTANSLTFRGHQAPTLLVLESADGQVDTVQFVVQVGTALRTDPTGPDGYGYFAYDNTDTSYEMHPEYQYVDISSAGAGGTVVAGMNDPGDKTSPLPVWAAARSLPFGFKFYGQVYDTITVCSNGWCAFGNQSYMDLFRNYPIPAMGAPDAMIAPYFDDLATTGSNRGIWTKSDTSTHSFIIQWKAAAWGGSGYTSPLDFEVILFDTTYLPTMDGNGKVQVQYNVATMGHESQFAAESDGCTIGIQAPGGRVGLSYAYDTTYSSGAAPVQGGRAILFTTAARTLFGSIEGQVTNSATGTPLPAAVVHINGYSYHATSDAAGHYLIPNVLIGTYTLSADAYRFNPDSIVGVIVRLDSTTTEVFSLRIRDSVFPPRPSRIPVLRRQASRISK